LPGELERFAALLGEEGPAPNVEVTVAPGGRAALEAMRRSGTLARLERAGVTVARVAMARVPRLGVRPARGLAYAAGAMELAVAPGEWRTASLESCAAAARGGRLADPRE